MSNQRDQCWVCAGKLICEPSVHLPCGHSYHTSCLQTNWESSSIRKCPSCGRGVIKTDAAFVFSPKHDVPRPTQEQENTEKTTFGQTFYGLAISAAAIGIGIAVASMRKRQ
ncbi:hypothetical protein SNEBB_003352 [Seison nebaliae]|nr:hypothetical protein SNEBB_003352 [Seison nebaliae]